ncbi:AAA family ATPase [Gimesia sp.]|uniref:AAA family ATPase n=1 Tax=Gimesia sp. TaxID=2024833 RepID=UPI0032EC07A8
MDTTLFLSLGNIIDSALTGNPKKVKAYARQLVDYLDELGEAEAASRIRSSVNGNRASKASISRAIQSVPKPIPVDHDSRFPLADEEIITSPVGIVFPENIQFTINRWIDSIRQADRLLEHGIEVPSTLLMHGPPGCGKSLLARYLAAELDLPLLTARSDALISSFLGSTSKNVRSLFDHVQNRPCILFLDEFDAIAKMRDDQREMGELKRVVISLLQNIDTLAGNTILLAATNHEHLLDPAVWRRFSTTIQIPLPSVQVRKSMLVNYFCGLVDEEVIFTLADLTEGMSGAQLKDLAQDAIRETILSGGSHVMPSTAFRVAAERITDGGALTTSDALRAVRDALGKSITQARLGEMFELSQSQVSRILRCAE